MKAKPITIDGIQFRSKLEGRWYLFMKRLGWNIMYEPEIEGLSNWIPDFLIIGKKHKILVDVKPIDKLNEWEQSPDKNRIENSGIQNTGYELLILGTNLNLNDDCDNLTGAFGVHYQNYRDMKDQENFCFGPDEKTNFFTYKSYASFCMRGPEYKTIDFLNSEFTWDGRITNEYGHRFNIQERDHKKIDTYWNEAWSQLQWNAPTSEHYLKGKTHPNSNQYCMDCKTNSVNWWKKKNLFYCTKCKEVKCFYCWKYEPYDSPKQYSVDKAWTKGGDAVEFFYATVDSESWGE
jgi:hypothetical protein